jgi:hypothetical protein
MISWHRLLGLILMDFFTGSYYKVDLEKDLTLQEQFLDILIIKKSVGQPPSSLPDGLENLSKYNLLTYKSMQEPLNSWTMKELVSSSVIYRKQISPSPKELLPETDFKLYAISTRYPQELAKRVTFKKIKNDVYDVSYGTDIIRVIVTTRLDKQSHNAPFLFFTGKADSFLFSDNNYRWRVASARGLLNQLYERYFKEGIVMSYTLDDFHREYTDKFIESLPPEVRLKGLSPEVVFKQYTPDEFLNRLPPEVRLQGLPPEKVFKQYTPDELLSGLSPEVIEEYLAKLKQK